MADWRERYRDRIVSAPEAVKSVRSGDRIILGHCVGEPGCLVDALMERNGEVENVEIFHMVAMGKSVYVQPEYSKSFRHNGQFLGRITSKAYAENRVDFSPIHLSNVPRCIVPGGTLEPDVAMIQVTPPDEDGRCSFGVSYDYTVQGATNAGTVIAQINKYMPRTAGPDIGLSDIDWIVEHDEPLVERKPVELGEVELAIGRNCASLIPDGATLQLGIGGIPDAVLYSLKGKKDLGIHSEMFSDGVVDLYNAGVVNGKKKTLHPGKLVATFLMGTKKLYDFVDNNPDVLMMPGNYTNDPYIIGENDLMHCVNSALQIDLMGQVNAESFGPVQFSGTGGQVDFLRGARRSKGGKSIIALPSTGANGTKSRIVLKFEDFTALTDPRTDVDYVVTEYGIASLFGQTIRNRARALINIAHPDFRDKLEEGAKKNHWLW